MQKKYFNQFAIGACMIVLLLGVFLFFYRAKENQIQEVHPKVSIYVNSPQEVLANFDELYPSYFLFSVNLNDTETKPDGVIVLNLSYQFAETDNLIKVLREYSTNGIISGEKSMMPITKDEERVFEKMDEINLEVSLIPVSLLN